MIHYRTHLNIKGSIYNKDEHSFLRIGHKYFSYDPRRTVLLTKKNSKVLYNKFKINSGCIIQVEENAELILGSGFINSDSKVQCYNYIEIGEKCFIAENVFIRDNDGHEINYEGKRVKKNEIIIGNNVWIGTGCVILSGATIVDNTVIAAGTEVNKKFPPNTLIGGNPAHVIKKHISWS